jgi:hypothetical protein
MKNKNKNEKAKTNKKKNKGKFLIFFRFFFFLKKKKKKNFLRLGGRGPPWPMASSAPACQIMLRILRANKTKNAYMISH